MLSISEMTPFVELAMDVHRNLSVCGSEAGQIFLASRQFCETAAVSLVSERIQVMHFDRVWPYFRLPARSDAVLGPMDDIIEINEWRMEFGSGIYTIFAGFHKASFLWVLSGELKWRSPLELELMRNLQYATTT